METENFKNLVNAKGCYRSTNEKSMPSNYDQELTPDSKNIIKGDDLKDHERAQRYMSTQPTRLKPEKVENLEDMSYSSRNHPVPTAKEESAQDSLDMTDHDEDSVNLDDALTKADDVIQDQEDDQRNPVQRSTRD